MDYAQKGHVKQTVFTKEMERFYTQYFSKSQDIEQAFGRVCSLTDDDPEAYSSPMHGTITADENGAREDAEQDEEASDTAQ